MFDIDKWTEIFDSIKKNKLRTFLTGLSISWGIFMFCVLLCAGNGLRNGVSSNFASRAVNMYNFWGRNTSVPYKGFPDNRPINIDEKDLSLVRQQPQAVNVSGSISNNLTVNYKTFNISGYFQGIHPDYSYINGVKILDAQGRLINDMDMKENRKVAVINQRMKEVLFQKDEAVGKQIFAGGLSFTVIGVFTEQSWSNEAKAYIPFSTAQMLYRGGNKNIDEIYFTVDGLKTKEENTVFEEAFRKKLSDLHIFDPKETRAIGIWNMLENYLQTQGIFNGISAFIWIIGIGTLIAGAISISNIMLITVRERTREFGIRKALGAKPSSIMGSILMESMLMTFVFGYVGMFLGVGIGEMANSILQNLPPEAEQVSHVFQNPTIEVNVALGAMLVLVVSGVLAGLYPAWKASRISPVIAMREE